MVEQAIELYKEINQFDKFMKLKLTVFEPGKLEYEMTIEDIHLSSPTTCHGGAIAGMMDAVIGTTALTKSFTEANLVSTIEFKINYFAPVSKGETLVGTGYIEFKGKSIIATSGEIRKKHNQELVAKGLGTFNVYPLEKRSEFLSMIVG